jgi:hypothetical protein
MPEDEGLTSAENPLVRQQREKWIHEDNLINHRLTWLLATQTLLLGAYGLLNQRITDWFFCPTTAQLLHLSFLMAFLPWIGVSLAVILAIGIGAACVAMTILIDEAPAQAKPYVHRYTTRAGWFTACAMPALFCAIWVVVAVKQPRRLRMPRRALRIAIRR